MPSEMALNKTQASRSKGMSTWLKIAWRLFIREFGRGELTIIGLSIILAVSSVMALSSITDRVEKAVLSQSAAFLAADRDLVSAHPIPDKFVSGAKDFQLQTDSHVYFQSMAFSGDEMSISIVKAVTETYPLRGKLFITNEPYTGNKVEKHGPEQGEAWLSQRLFFALQLDVERLKSGDYQHVEVGELKLQVTGIIDTEPDAPFEVFGSGTRIIMNLKDVPATNVIQPGSRISYAHLYAGEEENLEKFGDWLTPQLSENQSFRDVKQGASGISSSLDRAEGFLMLAGVHGVLLAATAVAVATRLYSQRHLDSIAIFKTLGASQQQVKVVYLFQLVLIATFSVLIGIGIGSGMQAIAVEMMANYLPDELPPIGLKPIVMATLTGFVCALMFSIPSLLKLFAIPPLRVLRRNLGDEIAASVMTRILMGLTTVLLVFLYCQDLKLTAIISASGVVLVALILVVANLMIRLSRKVGASVGGSALKIALASLKRRAKENASQLIGFTLAIMLILVLYSLENSIIQEWQEQMPEGTPNHFLINIAQHELDGVQEMVAEQGLQPEQYYPMIRGRLTHINETKLRQRDRAQDQGSKLRGETDNENNAENSAQTAAQTGNKSEDAGAVASEGEDGATEEEQPAGLGRELNLTFTETLAENNVILQGEWMIADQAKQVSVEQGIAERMNIQLGDKLVFLIGAREVSATVTSIREVDWNSFQPNFFMIFSNDVLADFPATYITSFYIPKEEKLWVNKLLKRFPTITVFDIEAMIEQIQKVIEQVSIAIRFVLMVVVAAATLVLLAQVQSSLDERRKETVIYRTLGAKGSMIQQAIILEFLSLGAIAGFIAATVAEVSLYLLQWQIFDMEWQLHWELWLIGPAVGASFVALVGAISTRSLLKMTPNELIRQLS